MAVKKRRKLFNERRPWTALLAFLLACPVAWLMEGVSFTAHPSTNIPHVAWDSIFSLGSLLSGVIYGIPAFCVTWVQESWLPRRPFFAQKNRQALGAAIGLAGLASLLLSLSSFVLGGGLIHGRLGVFKAFVIGLVSFTIFFAPWMAITYLARSAMLRFRGVRAGLLLYLVSIMIVMLVVADASLAGGGGDGDMQDVIGLSAVIPFTALVAGGLVDIVNRIFGNSPMAKSSVEV